MAPKYLTFPIIIILLIFRPSPSFLQNYTLSNWTVEDGLSSNKITDVFQDGAGFMWIATEHGLNKFDGYHFSNYRHNPQDTTLPGANFINSICLDESENIWINLAVGIVSKYDQLDQKFTNYFFPKRNTSIYQIKNIPKQGIGIATNQGLFTIDSLNNKLKLWKPEGHSNQAIYNFFPSSEHVLYVSMESGFKIYNLSTNKMEHTLIKGDDGLGYFTHEVAKYFRDAAGVHWLETSYGSLYQSADGIQYKKIIYGTGRNFISPTNELFLLEDKHKRKWYYSNNDVMLLQNKGNNNWDPMEDQPEKGGFSFIDKEKRLYVFTKKNKLKKWNGSNWEVILDMNKQLNFWEVTQVYIDKENGIWFASRGKGLWRIIQRNWPINSIQGSSQQTAINFPIVSMLVDHPDFIRLAAPNNIYRFYPDSKELVPLFSNKSDKNPLINYSVNTMIVDKDKELWIGTNRGIVLYHEDKKKCHQFNGVRVNGEAFNLGTIRSLAEDKQENIWIGTNKGLFRFDYQRRRFNYFYSTQFNIHSLRSTDIQEVFPIGESDFLIGYVKEGVDLCHYDTLSQTLSCQKITYPGAKSSQFDMMTANTFYFTGKDYWVGTYSKGLLKLDLEKLTMTPLAEDFPIIPNVKSIEKGINDNLWISSIDGIRSIHPKSLNYYRFTKSAGLTSNQFYRSSSVQDTLGNLYFGSTKGLIQIQPSKWQKQDTVATPILTNFKKYDENITFNQPLNRVQTIQLNYKDDYITFEFVSPTFHNPQDVQYAYQLEGFEDHWKYCSQQLSATYTNLPPGEYTFKIQAGNKGGFLNSEIKQVKLIVAPPYWQSSWFLFFTAGILLSSIFLVNKIQWQIRLNRLKIQTETRQKAADDFHDELGHRLTKMSLFVESLMLEKDSFSSKSAYILKKIQSNANELYSSTKDFIWAMNPTKDSALELFVFLRDFGLELYTDTEIHFSVTGIKEGCKDYLLDMDLKRQLIMIFKEAMTNALKHSNASEVILDIRECQNSLEIALIDNGQGYDLNQNKMGNGHNSMFNRSKKVGGILEINSQVGKGTTVLFKK